MESFALLNEIEDRKKRQIGGEGARKIKVNFEKSKMRAKHFLSVLAAFNFT